MRPTDLGVLKLALLSAIAGGCGDPQVVAVPVPVPFDNTPPCLEDGDDDNDGVCNTVDPCFGEDATGDADSDGLCNDVDPCFGDDATGDQDADGLCNDEDRCFGVDATGDADGDRVCDDMDRCEGADQEGDADADGICDDIDRCLGDDATGDADLDAVCNDRDACEGDDATGDPDNDGLCTDVDLCLGDNTTGDSDGDKVCDDRDLCQGDDATGDPDNDGICTDLDPCFGTNGDSDGDGVCDGMDACAGWDRTGDRDGDGICDDADVCDDRSVDASVDCTPLPTLPANPCGGDPIVFEGRHTGYVTCPDGGINRVFATSGWLPVPGALNGVASYFPGAMFDPATSGCEQHSECDAMPHGLCIDHHGLYGFESCTYFCDSDADCNDGYACAPPNAGRFPAFPAPPRNGSRLGLCVPASCTDASDCLSGECGLSSDYTYCMNRTALACRDAALDSCTVDDACPTMPDRFSHCRHEEGSGFQCDLSSSTCGRPLTDAFGVIRAAITQVRTDWRSPITVRTVPATALSRDAVIAHWRRIGGLEHASVASFARHILELLSLGAPADLIEGVQQAMADEVRHATLAYGIASAYAQAPQGPGTLDVSQTPPRTGWRDILHGVVMEGCIGETVAAAEARWAASRAHDPSIRDVLTKIADDEQAHAALAWKTVRWMLRQRPELTPTVARWIADATPARPNHAQPHSLAAFGLTGTAELQALTADVFATVIEPCLDALGHAVAGSTDQNPIVTNSPS